MRGEKIEIEKVRMVFCDVYGTLMGVQSPPADAEEQWQTLSAKFIPRTRISLKELAFRCDRWVSSDHEAARRQGILHPEVDWANVMRRALPELEESSENKQADFVYAHMQLRHRVSLKSGVVPFVGACRARGIRLALVSNAQAYTLRELETVMHGQGCSLEDFDSEWNFWSYVAGFSKPDPEVFLGLARRLAERGFSPREVLMIGDRFDNDIEPSRSVGFVTWWLAESGDGDWFELGRKFLPPIPGEEMFR